MDCPESTDVQNVCINANAELAVLVQSASMLYRCAVVITNQEEAYQRASSQCSSVVLDMKDMKKTT